jgi:hypothetical protein
VAKFEEVLKSKYNMVLDNTQNNLNLNDRALSGTDSSNDPEADMFNRAREEVSDQSYLVLT